MDKLWLVPLILFLAVGFCVIAVGVLQIQLNRYLREHHIEKWKYLTSSRWFGPGGANSLRAIPFLYSNDDLGDSVVRLYKKRIRKLLLYIFIGVIAVALVSLLITVFFEIPS